MTTAARDPGLRDLYPEIDPFDSGRLDVGDGHEIYWESCGNPQGRPIIFLHGGPGAGCMPAYRRIADPARCRIVLFDQRGCGRSTPHGSLEANTTWHLVADIERLRAHLGIDRWLVFGGSWGSALALAYGETHRQAVAGLVLRGIFTLRRSELLWFYQDGASWLFPDLWEGFLAPIPPAERDDLMAAYRRRLTGPDVAVQLEAARAWSLWEGGTLTLRPSPANLHSFGEDRFALAFARIENHYFVNGGFYPEGGLIENAGRLKDIPGVIVQGRYDVVTPARTAFDLHRAWPEADFHLITEAGHAFDEPGTLDRLIRATDAYAATGDPRGG